MSNVLQIIIILITGVGLIFTITGTFEKDEFVQRLGVALILIGIFVIQFGASK